MKAVSNLVMLICISAVVLLHCVQAQNGTVTSTKAPPLNITQSTEATSVSTKQVEDSKIQKKVATSSVAPTSTAAPKSTSTIPPKSSSIRPANETVKERSSESQTTTQASTPVPPSSSSVAPSSTSTNPPTTTTTLPPKTTNTTTTTTTTTTTSTVPPTTTVKEEHPPPEALTETSTQPPEPIVLGPVVKLVQGEVRPLQLKSRGGRKYYAFRGIPYGIPPVFFQRFKESGPVAPWSGVLNATSYGPSCIQYNILTSKVEGEEDCLHLNIFTPKLQTNETEKFPVMVFFHQGAFMFGTSSDFEEKYMMDEDVVLVTVNYRLGAFGFLNTQGDSDAKGNMGLKDQVVALKFIRENIHKFNGEANLLTIFGESAGASSVHYHLLSERSKGLFSRAISMSGTALSPWAFTRSPRRAAKKLGTLLNCPTTDLNELFTCLQGQDATVIAAKTKDLYEWNTDPITPFAPSIEVEESYNSFITQSPYTLMKNGQINDATPWMLGVVEDVCLLDAWSILVEPQLIEDMNVDWHRIAPTSFMFKETALEPDAVSNQIRAYYFGTRDIGNETAANLTNLYSDRYFNHGVRTSALMHVRTNEAIPVYMYTFNYRGAQSHTKFAGISDILGVSEGDDLRYLFNTNRFDDISLNTTDGDISQKLVKLWVSFAREGKPTEVWGKQEWTRITAAQVKGDEALMYYSLNKECGFIDEPFSARMNFWDNLPLNENDNELLMSSLNRGYQGGDDDFFNSFN